jgi:hypothetical protein
MNRKVDQDIIRQGETMLHRLFTAAFVIDPLIIKHLTGRERQRFGLPARKMKDLRRDVMCSMGWIGNSETTFTTRFWTPFRSVVHAAAAYILKTREPLIWPPRIEVLLERFESAELLKGVVLLSEGIRQNKGLLGELKIKETETLQFFPD